MPQYRYMQQGPGPEPPVEQVAPQSAAQLPVFSPDKRAKRFSLPAAKFLLPAVRFSLPALNPAMAAALPPLPRPRRNYTPFAPRGASSRNAPAPDAVT
jgi:hypothetical protein